MTTKKEKDLIIKSEPASMEQALIEIVKRTDIDPDRLEKFLDLQIKMEERQQKKSFQLALAAFQKDCPVIKKTRKIDFKSKTGNTTKYNYAPLDEIVSIIKPSMGKHGLSYSFDIVKMEGAQNELITTIYHEDGYEKTSSYFYYELHDDARMNQSQRAKSAVTYAKRAGLEDALGIVTAEEDDDARRALDRMVTSDQLDEILDIMKNTDTTETAFKKFMKVSNLEDLTESEADRAIIALRSKRGNLCLQK